MPKEFIVAREDLLSVYICTSLSKEEASIRIKSEVPCGASNGWTYDDDEELAQLQGSPCKQTKGHVHFIFSC